MAKTAPLRIARLMRSNTQKIPIVSPLSDVCRSPLSLSLSISPPFLFSAGSSGPQDVNRGDLDDSPPPPPLFFALTPFGHVTSIDERERWTSALESRLLSPPPFLFHHGLANKRGGGQGRGTRRVPHPPCLKPPPPLPFPPFPAFQPPPLLPRT